MASAPPATASERSESPDRSDRVERLEVELSRAERRRRAAEEWAEFLEGELTARSDELEAVRYHYERLLEAAQEEASEGGRTEQSVRLRTQVRGWVARRFR